MRRMVAYFLILLILLGFIATVVWMPGASFQGSLPTASEDERELASRLEAHVRALADEIGPRSVVRYDNLKRAEDYIRETFKGFGYEVQEQDFVIAETEIRVRNLSVSISGQQPRKSIVVGAHYDSVGMHCPGANDNGSGVAAVLELARIFRQANIRPKQTIHLVAFVNEEPPFFRTENMGSLRFARELNQRDEDVTAMISVETIGYFSDEAGSQSYPFPFSLFYPDTGNFIGFVGNMRSAVLVRKVIQQFREETAFPSEGTSAPAFIPGIGWSDQWAFWQQGYPALMVTDTAPFRYPDYHLPSDTYDKLDYDKMARVVKGLSSVIRSLSE